MRTFTRRLYLLSALLVSITACVHFAVNPLSGPDDSDVLRLYEFILGLLIVTWLIKDPKLANAERPSFDHGLLHLTFFPLLAAYEQFVIRRWKGLAVVFGLLILLMAPLLMALIQFSVA